MLSLKRLLHGKTTIGLFYDQRNRNSGLHCAAPVFASVSNYTMLEARADMILRFWIGEDWATMPKTYASSDWYGKWFKRDEELDKQLKETFSPDLDAMRNGTLEAWKEHPMNCLAGIILMDQFSRNIYRDTPQMYDLDAKAKDWAKSLSSGPEYPDFHPALKLFVILPFMHSEDISDQEHCITLLSEAADKVRADDGDDATILKMISASIDYGHKHKEVVSKWGRFPHRNSILGRESTPEEAAGLADGTIAGF